MFEYLIISLIMLWSIYIVFKKVFPSSYQKLFSQLADYCQKQGWQSLAKWLRPPMSVGCSGGCGCKASEAPPSLVKWK